MQFWFVSHGIGAHIARALAARDTNLLLVARSEAELARLAKELQADGSTVAVAAVDLGGPHAARQVAEAAAAALGAVDVLVNNAATEPQTRFHVLTPAEIEHVLHVDLIGPLLLARLVRCRVLGRCCWWRAWPGSARPVCWRTRAGRPCGLA